MPCSAFSSSNSIWRMVVPVSRLTPCPFRVIGVGVHIPQSSSASRRTARAAGFLDLSQSVERPER